ncbi:MarR family winged helix-turn-helix transcriptional regulator [Caulobacter sp. S45]|uniref:MarR family winged helix-turn-helix transcriptional regulator n=1 Tax=Caulobacter sp. S45 TaxID=1641861 RepID=UPI0015763EBC|nr:MarR family winged helix-turn-helix transcriptional regulator [Caulobacter sp. S45]
MSDSEASWRVENIGRALSFASAVFERDVLRTVQQGEFAWVRPVQLALFRNLDLDGTPLTELAARARITKQSMQELVDKAERFGVVVRRPDPDDRRVKIVAFTPAGLMMLERFREGVAEAERRMAEALGDDVMRDLKTRLQAYVEADDLSGTGPNAQASRSSRAIPASGRLKA